MRALVTGAGKRLGRAMALYLADRGYDVAIHYASSSADAEAVAQEVRSKGRAAAALKANLLDHEATLSLVPRAAGALGGPLSILVNNASIFEHDTIATATLESWDRHMSSNLRAPLFLTQAFADQVPEVERDGNDEPLVQGLVVNMIDQRVHKLTPEFMTYTLAKMGLWAFTRTAAQALADKARVNGIGPGPTMQGGRQPAEHFAAQRAATVLGRGANPRDITGALGYFIDSPAVTGQMISIDGGQHLAWQTPDVLGVE